MKTPIQELYERLWEADKDRFTWNAILKEMLEKEKEVIMDAHIEGQRVFDKFPHTQWTNDQAEQHYNELFNTKEK